MSRDKEESTRFGSRGAGDGTGGEGERVEWVGRSGVVEGDERDPRTKLRSGGLSEAGALGRAVRLRNGRRDLKEERATRDALVQQVIAAKDVAKVCEAVMDAVNEGLLDIRAEWLGTFDALCKDEALRREFADAVFELTAYG